MLSHCKAAGAILMPSFAVLVADGNDGGRSRLPLVGTGNPCSDAHFGARVPRFDASYRTPSTISLQKPQTRQRTPRTPP
jgi:hypothetical protein